MSRLIEEFDTYKKIRLIKMVRKANAGDTAYISEVYCMSWKEGYRGIISEKYLNSLTPEIMTARGFDPSDYLVYETDGRVVGLVNFGKSRDCTAVNTGEIRALCVLPEYWRGGIGSELFKAACDELCKNGYEVFYLLTLEDNVRARRFYEKMGMTLIPEKKRITISGNEYTEVKYEFIFEKESK